MKYFAPLCLLLAASLTSGATYAQEAPVSEPLDVTARFVPAAPPEAVPEPLPTATPAAPTTVELTGYVLDEQKQPLRGATVLLKGTTTATSTDATGHYSLPVPAGINTLLYDYVGRESRQVAASNFLPVTVILPPANSKMRNRK